MKTDLQHKTENRQFAMGNKQKATGNWHCLKCKKQDAMRMGKQNCILQNVNGRLSVSGYSLPIVNCFGYLKYRIAHYLFSNVLFFRRLPIAYCLLPIVCCLLPFSLSAQLLPLDSVLSRIEQNNPMLKMYDEQISAVKNYAQMTKSWMPPSLSTGTWQAPYKNFNEGMWMITGEQMIPNPSKQKANYNFMNGMTAVEQHGKNAKRNEMFAMARQNYFEWVVLQKKYNVLIQTDSVLNYMVEVARLRYKYNKEKLSNIYKSQADLFDLRNMETMLISDMKMKNIELNTLMNTDISFVFEVDTNILLHNYELQLPDTAVISASRSEIKQFDDNIGLLQMKQKFEKSKRLPDFGISYTHMQSLNGMPNQFSAMGTMTIPIAPWSSNEYKSSTRGLDNDIHALNYQKQALIIETVGMIASLQAQILAAKKQLKNFDEDIIPTYFKSYQAAMLAYEENTEDLFVVLDGLKMYRMAKLSQLDQLNTLLKLQVDYEKEMEIR